MADITKAEWTYDHAAHLLERAGFGHDGNIHKSGAAKSVLRLLSSSRKQPADFIDSLFPRKPKKLPSRVRTGDDEVLIRWLKQMYKANGRRTVQEKMTLFLHVHFTTQRSVVTNPRLWDQQIGLFRHHSVFDFRALAKAVNVDNAMLQFLDGASNELGNVNENYGRELLELYLLGSFDFAGQRNYSQTDVAEVARMLSGWVISSGSSRDPFFSGRFDPARHDPGFKTVFAPDPVSTPLMNPANEFTVGDLGELEHEFLIDKVFDHLDSEGRPTVARNITRRLWRFFAWDPEVTADTPRSDLAMIDELVDVFVTGTPGDGQPYQLHNLLRAMFLRTEFYQYLGQGRSVKSPVEFVVSTVRKLRAGARTPLADRRFVSDDELFPMTDMGQELYQPPNVAGWPGNLAWVSTTGFLERADWAKTLTERDFTSTSPGLRIDKLARKWFANTPATRAAVVDRVLYLMGPLQVSTATRQALIDWLGPDDSVVDVEDSSFQRIRLRGLLYLTCSIPEYHVI